MRVLDAQAPCDIDLTASDAAAGPDCLVAMSSETPLIIQGHPGTGKTVVATHRAAYLVDDSRNAIEIKRRVLLLGPTSEYKAACRQHRLEAIKIIELSSRI